LFIAVRKRLLIKPWQIALYVIVMIFVIISGIIEYRSRYRDVLQLIQDQASVTAAVVAQSASVQAYLSDEVGNSYVDRALDLLRVINQLDALGTLTPPQLNDLINDTDLMQIVFVNGRGEIENSYANSLSQQNAETLKKAEWVLNDIGSILKQREKTIIRGLDSKKAESSRFLVAIERSKGGVIACHLSPAAEEDYQYITSIESALEEILYVKGLRYLEIDIDGGESFSVSREGIIMDGSWTREPLEDILFRVRKGDVSLLEVVRPVFFNSSMGEVRIGFVADELTSLRNQIVRELLLRGTLLSILTIVILIWLLTRQNAALLAEEKKRIEAEVYRLEKLNRINEKQVAMGELAAGVAHEIRNPLNAIGLVAQRLKREFKPEDAVDEYQTLTGTMVTEIGRINRSLQEFLEYTRPTPLKFSSAKLKTTFNKLLDLYQSQANDKKLLLYFETPEIKIEIDEEYIQQALSNILKNAIEACSEGDSISMKADKIKTGLKITITDTGMGIEPENLNRIFDLYYTNKNMGTGVGLAITHKIIADHHGSIEVSSDLGTGTKFEIRLPAKQ